MDFEKAVKEMDKGKICENNTGMKYRIDCGELQYFSTNDGWKKSHTWLIKHFESNWEIVEEKEDVKCIFGIDIVTDTKIPKGTIAMGYKNLDGSITIGSFVKVPTEEKPDFVCNHCGICVEEKDMGNKCPRCFGWLYDMDCRVKKETLSDKIFGVPQKLIPEDVKQANKEFIDWLDDDSIGKSKDYFLRKAKDIYGDGLI